MTLWTPDEVRRVLDAREAPALRRLASELIAAATRGRAFLLRKKPWLGDAGRSKEEDVQDAVTALFERDARLLRKFGDYAEFRSSEHALQNYVIGITFFVLQKKYQKQQVNWEQIHVDLASSDDDPGFFAGFARFIRVLDLERVVAALSPQDQALFRLLYVEQREGPAICERLGDITVDTFQQRKTRLLKRLRQLLEGGANS